jgi:hypothetical protein
MSMPHRIASLAVATALLTAGPAIAQSLQQRIDDHNRRQRQQHQSQQQSVEEARARQQASLNQRMGDVMTGVRFENTPLRQALTWWSQAANVPIVVNWEKLRSAGIDEDTPINLVLNHVPAEIVLRIVLGQIVQFEDNQMIAETTPWYVHIMTRDDALSRPVTRVYDLADLLMDVPNFTNAPSFSLEDALDSGNSSGGSGGSGGSGSSSGMSLFGGDDDDDDDDNNDDQNSGSTRTTRVERGQQIAQLIRDSIEPDIWYANGGRYASVRVFQNRLIVTAAPFVQRQIGGSLASSRPGTPGTYRGPLTPSPGANPSTVSGVAESSSRPPGRNHSGVSGIAE